MVHAGIRVDDPAETTCSACRLGMGAMAIRLLRKGRPMFRLSNDDQLTSTRCCTDIYIYMYIRIYTMFSNLLVHVFFIMCHLFSLNHLGVHLF